MKGQQLPFLKSVVDFDIVIEIGSAQEQGQLLFFVARPVSVWLGLTGAITVSRDQRAMISWFGIRGVGSIFYLMYAINHGLPESLAKELIAFTLTTVAASVVLHGISVTPLMSLYVRRRTRRVR